MITTTQAKRLRDEWSRLAKSHVEVEQIGSFLYAFGSELAVRRLAHEFKSFDCGFSSNLNTWYFRKDAPNA
jgi:hypothetical protein